jgi:hypothetical protein
VTAAASKQISIGGLETTEDVEKETVAAHLWRDQLYAAIKSFALAYIDVDSGGRGYDACAARLDKQWGDPERGRAVTGAILKATLNDSERNYFRAEWLHWFASRCPEVAALMARQVKPTKTAEERIADIEAELFETLSHREATRVIRRARAR